MRHINEINKVPIAGGYDVIVCGGGPAGTAAAIAAGRQGARTLLIEGHGALGGIWTTGLLSWILDCSNKTGIMKEIMLKLEARGAGSVVRGKNYICDCEELKLLLEELCQESGVEIRLHTRTAAAVKTAEDKLHCIITESKAGREAWEAKIFIDATGDGDLGAQAGCSYRLGKPGTGETQPMTLLALLTGINADEVREYNNTLEYVNGSPKKRFLEEIKRSGVVPSYQDPALWHVEDNIFILMANHQYGVSALEASAITKATLEGRKEIHHIVKGLKSLGGVWKDIRIISTGEQIGIREGRRIQGLYTITEEDLIKGAAHEDGICRVTFKADIHSPDPLKSKGYDHEGIVTKPYDIPLRALISKEVKNLLMAGRCISGDFVAHSSYRVTGNAVEMGQAAGVLGAVSALEEELPGNIPYNKVKEALNRL